jgi:acetyltransferase-like isoleucine patch superfamily enzyme
MHSLKLLLFKHKLQKKVIFEKGTIIDYNCFFEGSNRVARGSQLYNVDLKFGSYIGRNSTLENVSIGKFSCIGPRVININGEHPLDFISMHPAFYSTKKQSGFTYVEKNIYDEFRYADIENKKTLVIGNDVWVAADVRFVDGIKIGDGAAVLAGAVVTKDVPPYAIVGGVPAKVIRYRFSESQIDYLLKLQWWDKGEQWIRKNANLFKNIDTLISSNIDDLVGSNEKEE